MVIELREPIARPFAVSRNRHILLGLHVLLAVVFAYQECFLLDDAFISFRYADNFAQGHGLVWYTGSSEYGYTNFLFTLIVGLLMKLGLTVPAAPFLVSIPAYIGSIILTFAIGQRVCSHIAVPVIACIALATHLTFASYATSGLETSLQTFLILYVYWQFFKIREAHYNSSVLPLAFTASMALLTRLDSAILLIPVYGALSIDLLRMHLMSEAGALRKLISAAIVPLVTLIIFFICCHIFYGHALPNSFYVKIDSSWHIDNGLRYIVSFIFYQGFLPGLLVFLWLAGWSESRFRLQWAMHRVLFFSAVLIWCIYLLYVGGDFMQFRFMVPVLPLFFLLAFDAILAPAKKSWDILALLLLAFIGYGSMAQREYFTPERRVDPAGVESFDFLNSVVAADAVNWSDAGKALYRYFYHGQPDDVSIAISAAGALPYYAKLPTLDLLGLNSLDVMQNAEPLLEFKPGHRVRATLQYTQSQHVNLIIDFPNFLHKEADGYKCLPIEGVMVYHYGHLPIIHIPVKDGYYLSAVYLTPHPDIEALLENKTILRYDNIKNNVHCIKWYFTKRTSGKNGPVD